MPFVVLGVGVLGLLGAGLFLSTDEGKAVERAAENVARAAKREVMYLIEGWFNVLLKKTSEHEGTYWSVNRNLDGQGVSYGCIQWTQLGGGLYKVLLRMQQADPNAFARIFGPGAARMMMVVSNKSLESVDGAYLWNEPWLSRFREAGHWPAFQQAQITEALQSEYMQAAIQIANLLGVKTERAMVMYFNRTVHQGPAGALNPAKALAGDWQKGRIKRPATDREVLLQYGWLCAASFRRVGGPPSGSKQDWRLVSQEYPELAAGDRYIAGKRVPAPPNTYHVFKGDDFDIYDLIVNRTRQILTDPELRDQPVNLSKG